MKLLHKLTLQFEEIISKIRAFALCTFLLMPAMITIHAQEFTWSYGAGNSDGIFLSNPITTGTVQINPDASLALLSALSGNTTLFICQVAVDQRSILIMPMLGANGTANMTVTGNDGVGGTVSKIIPITVLNPKNYGLIFRTSDGKFFLDIDSDGAINTGDMEYTPAGATWSSGTLSLNGFSWVTPAPVALTILGGTDLNLNISGTNTLTSAFGASVTNSTRGISASGIKLNIDGSGTLNVTADGTTSGDSYGINGNISVTGGTVRVTGGTIATGTGNSSYGISGNVTVSGGSLTATGRAGRYSHGISGMLTVSGGSITATGGTAITGSNGIYGMGASITITGGTVNTTGETAGSSSYGISCNSPVKVTGGTLTAQGNTRALGVSAFTPPAAYSYWMNTTEAPSGTEIIVPDGTAFDNDADTYKYVKIDAATNYGLIFNTSDGKFYLDRNNNGFYNSGTDT